MERLSPVKSAPHDAMNIPSCLRGTRMDILEDICAWAVQKPGKDVPNVFFLNGVAGSGKSTIAKTICVMLKGVGCLVASFFCSRRSTAEQRNVRSIFPTLAYLLSLHSLRFAEELHKALQENKCKDDGLR